MKITKNNDFSAARLHDILSMIVDEIPYMKIARRIKNVSRCSGWSPRSVNMLVAIMAKKSWPSLNLLRYDAGAVIDALRYTKVNKEHLVSNDDILMFLKGE